MDKAGVIKWRDTLKCGKNYPLRIMFDNNYQADESIPLNYIKWDDNNGIIYVFRLTNLTDSRNPSNKGQYMSVWSAPYDLVWYLELSPFKVDKLDTLFESMESNGVVFNNPQFKENIKYAFTEATHPGRWRLDNTDLNNLTGSTVADTRDEYYRGRFVENFKETRDHALLNEYIAKKKAEAQEPENP